MAWLHRLWRGSDAFGTFLLLEKYTSNECLKRCRCCCCFSRVFGERLLTPTATAASFWSPQTNNEIKATTINCRSHPTCILGDPLLLLLFLEKMERRKKKGGGGGERIARQKGRRRETGKAYTLCLAVKGGKRQMWGYYWVYPANKGHISRGGPCIILCASRELSCLICFLFLLSDPELWVTLPTPIYDM